MTGGFSGEYRLETCTETANIDNRSRDVAGPGFDTRRQNPTGSPSIQLQPAFYRYCQHPPGTASILQVLQASSRYCQRPPGTVLQSSFRNRKHPPITACRHPLGTASILQVLPASSRYCQHPPGAANILRFLRNCEYLP
jgi:hypothetical protein